MEREERGGEGRREGKERREEGEAVVKEIGSSKERGKGEGGEGGLGGQNQCRSAVYMHIHPSTVDKHHRKMWFTD